MKNKKIQIYPAIDILNNQCVRLCQGDFQTAKTYSFSPNKVAEQYLKEGAKWVHIVDLAGAKTGQYYIYKIIQKISSLYPNLKIQTGGGIVNLEIANKIFDHGAARIVIGSLAIKNPELFIEMLNHFGNKKITLAIDIQIIDNIPYVTTNAWNKVSSISFFDLINRFPFIENIICTDIAKDGMLSGPNLNLYRHLKNEYPHLNLQASGGVSSLNDIKNLKNTGADGVIIGKALYEQKFTVAEALQC